MKKLVKSLLPQRFWGGLRSTKAKILSDGVARLGQGCLSMIEESDLQRALDNLGYNVSRKIDYYSPLPSVADLRATQNRWNKPSALHGIAFDLDEMRTLLSNVIGLYGKEFAAFPPYREAVNMGFGPGYPAVDAFTLYVMIRHLKPARYVEVGSGLSTYYASLAAAKNAEEGAPVSMTCIEPHPYEKLRSVPNISIAKHEVQNVDPSLFQSLKANDILFIDSSHILRVDGDVPYLFLEVLPTIGPGVIIHVHDVPFPYNFPYPPELWIFGQKWPMFWNEAMVLQALLSGNRDFEIVLSTPLLRHFDEQFLRDRIPVYESVKENQNTFSSIWLKKHA